MKRIFIIKTLVIFLSLAEGSRILITSLTGTKSHQNTYVPLAKELVKRGHSVTVISNYVSSELKTLTADQVHQIVLPELELDLTKYPNVFSTVVLPPMEQARALISIIKTSINMPAEAAEVVYNDQRVLDLIANDHFDLVMMTVAGLQIGYPLAWHFKAPHIILSPNILISPLGTLLGDSDHTEHLPNLFGTYTDQMNLKERAINTLGTWVFNYLFFEWNANAIQKAANKIMPDCPPISEIEKNVSLVFTNTHPTFSYPRTLTPEVIEVGAIQCRPANPLPKDLDDFVSQSGENGFIIFGIGSAYSMNDMPEHMVEAIVKVFSSIPRHVVWQLKGKPKFDLPKNIKTVSWLPQQDLLGHKNCRLFITHGGLNSLQESMYHGVPVLGLPFGTDQYLNMGRAVRDGYALRLDWKDLTVETLSGSIHELLTDSSYLENVKRKSFLLRDQLQTPLERAVFWTEFAMRHNGTRHLRLASRDLAPYQRALLDVYALLIFISVLPILLIFLCLRKCCCKTKYQSVDNKKKIN